MKNMFEAALKCKTKEEAKAFLNAYVASIRSERKCDEVEAMKICQSNLGYFVGYYPIEYRLRIEELFEATHPIFGSIKKDGIPSIEIAYKKGLKLGGKQHG